MKRLTVLCIALTAAFMVGSLLTSAHPAASASSVTHVTSIAFSVSDDMGVNVENASANQPMPTCWPGDKRCWPEDRVELEVATANQPMPTCWPGDKRCWPEDRAELEVATANQPMPTCWPGDKRCWPEDRSDS